MHTFVVCFHSLTAFTSWSSPEWVGLWVSLHLPARGSSMDLGKKGQKWGKCCPMAVALMHQWAESTAPVLCRHTSAVLMTEKASPLKQSLSSQHLNSLQMPRCSYCCTGTIPANPAYSGRIRPPALPCPTGKPQTTSGLNHSSRATVPLTSPPLIHTPLCPWDNCRDPLPGKAMQSILNRLNSQRDWGTVTCWSPLACPGALSVRQK